MEKLLKYIKKARGFGLEDKKIEKNLTISGWSKDKIKKGFVLLNVQKNENVKEKKKQCGVTHKFSKAGIIKKIFWFLFGIVFLGSIVLNVYFIRCVIFGEIERIEEDVMYLLGGGYIIAHGTSSYAEQMVFSQKKKEEKKVEKVNKEEEALKNAEIDVWILQKKPEYHYDDERLLEYKILKKGNKAIDKMSIFEVKFVDKNLKVVCKIDEIPPYASALQGEWNLLGSEESKLLFRDEAHFQLRRQGEEALTEYSFLERANSLDDINKILLKSNNLDEIANFYQSRTRFFLREEAKNITYKMARDWQESRTYDFACFLGNRLSDFGQFTCKNNNNGFLMLVRLNLSDEYYCIDETGFMGVIKNKPGEEKFRCK